MGAINKYPTNEERFFEEIRSLNWVGLNKITLDEGKMTLFYSTLIFQPEFWEKLIKDPSFEPKELQNLLNALLAKFTVSLAACLRSAAEGIPVDLHLLIGFSEMLDHMMNLTVETADAFESHRKTEKGEQSLPFFLRYGRSMVEDRFFDALCAANSSGEVLSNVMVKELLAGCSPKEKKAIKEQLDNINEIVAELRLREATKEDISAQLSDLLDDFFNKTEP